MKNKTCGECKHYGTPHNCVCIFAQPDYNAVDKGCKDFERRIITNGDRIREMSNEELARLFAYPCPPGIKKKCSGRDNEECRLCWLNRLNAPAESEVNNG